MVAFKDKFPAQMLELIQKYPAFKKLLSMNRVGRPIIRQVADSNSNLTPPAESSEEPVMVEIEPHLSARDDIKLPNSQVETAVNDSPPPLEDVQNSSSESSDGFGDRL